MPCDTIRTNSVDLSALGKIDLNLLVQAFNALGVGGRLSADKREIMTDSGTYNVATGRLQMRERVTLDQVKQAYSAEVVKSTAKRYGWTLKQTAQFQFQVVKR